MPIHGIFYARFLPQLGTKIVAQSPPGCIVPVAVADESDDDEEGDRDDGAAAAGTAGARRQRGKALFDFDVMQEFVIPRAAFFNRYLAAREPSGRYAVLGLPVAIRDDKYHRNAFIFNFGLVVGAADDQGPYERVVRRLASTFFEMEKRNEFLSREERREVRKRGGGGGMPDPMASGGGGGGGGGASNSMADMAGSGSAHFGTSGMDALFDHRRVMAASRPLLGSPQRSPQLHGQQSQPQPQSQQALLLQSAATLPLPSASRRLPPLALQAGHSPYHRRSIQSLLEIIKEDINLYGECMIPVDDANTINMKLFPQHANPPPVEGWHVPVPKMRLADAVDASWDLTLQRVIAHMDGVSDVRRIAFEADVSLELCRAAVRHLLYYDTVLLLDMFFFSSCYAPRPGIHDFVANVGGIVDECARYVCLGRGGSGAGSDASDGGDAGAGPAGPAGGIGDGRPGDAARPPSSAAAAAAASTSADRRPPRVSNYDLIRLMTSFCVGRTVTEWLKGHADAGFDVLRFVDVRRLVQFGVIKGCLYRVHKYVVSKQYLASLVTGRSRPAATADHADHADPLQQYTDANHHFDQIITEQNLTEVELIERLKRLPLPHGDLKILYR